MLIMLDPSDIITALAGLTVVAQVIALITLVALIVSLATKKHDGFIVRYIHAHGLVLLFIVALTATCASLYLSEIAGFTPCKDCWLQRIFMYPQVILLGIALWKRDRNIALYIFALSVIGIFLSGDHYGDQIMQAFFPEQLDEPCDATGVSCAKAEFFRFGYISIPLMAGTAFLLNIIGSLTMLTRKPKHS